MAIANVSIKESTIPYKPTIAQETLTFKQTGGHMNRDSENLLFKLIKYARGIDYDLVIQTPDYSRSTFSELNVPLTAEQARERYAREGVAAISPDFLQMLEKVENYNWLFKYSESSQSSSPFSIFTFSHRQEIDKIEITDFMNFLYFAEYALKRVNYYERKRKSRFGRFLRKSVEETVEDTKPILIVTNSEKDGLLYFFKEELMDIMQEKNRQLRIIDCGKGSTDALMEFYHNGFVGCFDAVSVSFREPSNEYFGIWADNMCLEAKFTGEKDILEIPNKIEGLWKSAWKYDYEWRLKSFEDLKNREREAGKN